MDTLLNLVRMMAIQSQTHYHLKLKVMARYLIEPNPSQFLTCLIIDLSQEIIFIVMLVSHLDLKKFCKD